MSSWVWVYAPEDGEPLVLGEYNHPNGDDGGLAHLTDSLEVAQRWARDLRAGRLPTDEATESSAS